MKKQLLIAAVAATMTSAAMADISISGDAKFEYQNVEATGVTTNTNQTNTEVNLKLRGKSGDTSVIVDVASDGNNSLVVEDQYITTKVGDVSVKAGNYSSSTSGILGEIDNGGRSHNKVTLTTTLGAAKIYAGNSGSQSAGFTSINNNMFAGISVDVAGMTVQAKKVSDTEDAVGIAGEMSGVAFRLEQSQGEGANADVTFGNITTEVNGISLGYAWLDADADGLIDEDDSAIFAVENGNAGSTAGGVGDSNKQLTISTSVAGNKVTVKSGTIGFAAATLDRDYMQVSASRALASGATASVTYTDKDTADATDSQTFEAELSVKF